MNILLIGASGMVGSRILDEAVSRGHNVTAAARTPGKIKAGPNVKAVALDAMDPPAVAGAAKGADVIIGATSPRSTGDAVAEMEAIGKGLIAGANASGARLVVVGGAGSLNYPNGTPVLPSLPEAVRPEALAMKRLLDVLAESDLDWTFFAPPLVIAPGEKTGKFRLGETTLIKDDAGNSRISAEDFAVALMDEVERPAHRRKVFTIAY